MAAVIAHEVKNPLAGIRGAIQVIGGRLPAGQHGRRDAEGDRRPHRRARRADEGSAAVRAPAASRVGADRRRAAWSTTTADLLEQDPALQGRARSRSTDRRRRLSADPEHAEDRVSEPADQRRARDAGQGHDPRRPSTAVGSTCQIAFSDAGPGIPSEIREKIFTPFFTTKSRGSGLGLPTAKRLIEAHDGAIAIDCPLPAAPR